MPSIEIKMFPCFDLMLDNTVVNTGGLNLAIRNCLEI